MGRVDVEGVEIEVAHLVEAFGGAGVGQGLGALVAPVLVLGLQLMATKALIETGADRPVWR